MKQLPSEVFAAAKAGDRAARDRILLANLGLVRKLAASYYRAPLPEVDDLFQVGVLGMMRAVELYEPDRASFSTYAGKWVQAHMREYARKVRRSVIIAPNHTTEFIERGLASMADNDPRREEYRRKAVARTRAISIDAQWKDQDTSILDRFVHSASDPEAEAASLERSEIFRRALGCLHPRELYIVQRRMRDVISADIAREQGVTRQRVEQIERRIYHKLIKALPAGFAGELR